MLQILISGFLTGLSLIVAIGPQNSFVIKQGIKRGYHIHIALLCSISDATLILLGSFGMGLFIESNTRVVEISSILGALLLLIYGLNHVLSIFQRDFKDDEEKSIFKDLWSITLFTLGLTFLNPHVYLDTVVLLGSISNSYRGSGKYLFNIGAISASFIWFFFLALGAEKLSPLFKSRVAWQILDGLIAITMLLTSYKLIKPLI